MAEDLLWDGARLRGGVEGMTYGFQSVYRTRKGKARTFFRGYSSPRPMCHKQTSHSAGVLPTSDYLISVPLPPRVHCMFATERLST